MPEPDQQPTAEQPAIPTSPDDLTEPLIAGMPEITEPSAPAGGEATPRPPPPVEPAARKSPGTGKFDASGVEFDPTIHFFRTDRPGTPRKDTRGNWWTPRARAAPAGAKNGAHVETISPTFAGSEPDPAPPPPPPPRYRINADKLAAITIPTFDRFMQGLLTEGAALTDEDKQELTPALTAYIESSEMKDLPPGVMLAVVVGGIYASKLNKPTVKERLVLFGMKLKAFFSRR